MPTETYLPLLIVAQSNRIKVFEDLFGVVVLLDLALKIKADHVVGANLRRKLEVLLKTLCLGLFKLFDTHRDNEMNVAIVMVLFVVLDSVMRT